MRNHDATNLEQFDPQATAYLTSAVHAAGPDLAAAAHLLAAQPRRTPPLSGRQSEIPGPEPVAPGTQELTELLTGFFRLHCIPG